MPFHVIALKAVLIEIRGWLPTHRHRLILRVHVVRESEIVKVGVLILLWVIIPFRILINHNRLVIFKRQFETRVLINWKVKSELLVKINYVSVKVPQLNSDHTLNAISYLKVVRD